MGQSISSVTDMVSYAGALRRAVQQAPMPEAAQKIQRSAAELEKTASPGSGWRGRVSARCWIRLSDFGP
jgi:hypothetical protein